MQGIHKETIDLKLNELKRDLKIDPSDAEWQKNLLKKLRIIRIEHRIFLAISLMIVVSTSGLMFITLLFEGKAWHGLEFNRQLFFLLFIINFSTLVFTVAGSLRVKKHKIKTLLFLQDLKNE